MGKSCPAVLLDTNVVLDWLVFDDAAVQPVVAAVMVQQLHLISSPACIDELQRALGYKAIGLETLAQARVLGAYREKVQVLDDPLPATSPMLPRCEDPDDQKFLELARHAGARWLVTRDKALLSLAGQMQKLAGVGVIAPLQFVAAFAAPS